jgi:putative transposase
MDEQGHGGSKIEATEEASLAERRAAVIRPLAARDKCTRKDAAEAAERLGVSRATVYALIRRWRDGDGDVGSLLPGRRGVKPGSVRIRSAILAVVETAIDDLWKGDPLPSKRSVVLQVEARCKAEGLDAPSPTTVRRRIDARSARP